MNNVPVYNVDPKAKKVGQKVKPEKVEKICADGKCMIAKDGEKPKKISAPPKKADGVHGGVKVGNNIVYH